jgi:hypothetical protein
MTDRTYRVAIVGLGRMGSTIDDEFPDRSPPYSVAGAFCRSKSAVMPCPPVYVDCKASQPPHSN